MNSRGALSHITKFFVGLASVAVLLGGAFALYTIVSPSQPEITIEQLQTITINITQTPPSTITAQIVVNGTYYYNGTSASWVNAEANATYEVLLPCQDYITYKICDLKLLNATNLTTSAVIQLLGPVTTYNITLRLWNGTAFEEFNYTGLGDAGAPEVYLYVNGNLENNKTLAITQETLNITIRAEVIDRAPTLGGEANLTVTYENGTVIYKTTLTWPSNTTNDQTNSTEYVLSLIPETNYTIELIAKDNVGNENYTYVKVVYDPLAPRIVEFNVSPIGYVDANITAISVKWNVTDANFANVTLYVQLPNGTVVNKTYNESVKEITDLFAELNLSKEVEGLYKVWIEACDLVGNCNISTAYTFTNDVEPPVVVYKTEPSIIDGIIVNTNRLTVIVGAYDDISPNVTVDVVVFDTEANKIIYEDSAVVESGKTITFVIDNLEYGKNYTIQVKGRDLAGHVKVAIYDEERPYINININYGQVYKNNITVLVTIEDVLSNYLKVVEINNQIYKENIYGTVIWNKTYNESGRYTITVYAEDLLGNANVDVVTFYVDTQVPNVTKVELNCNKLSNGVCYVPDKLVITLNITDDLDLPLTVTVLNGTEEICNATIRPGIETQITCDLEEGELYNLILNVTDQAGHYYEKPLGLVQSAGVLFHSEYLARVEIEKVLTWNESSNVTVIFKVVDEDEHGGIYVSVGGRDPYSLECSPTGYSGNQTCIAEFIGLPIGNHNVVACVKESLDGMAIDICAHDEAIVNYTPVLKVVTNVTPVILAVNEPVKIYVTVTDKYGTLIKGADVMLNDTLRNKTIISLTDTSGMATFIWSYPNVTEGVLKVCYGGVCKDVKVWVADKVIILNRGYYPFAVEFVENFTKTKEVLEEAYNTSIVNITPELFTYGYRFDVSEVAELTPLRGYFIYVAKPVRLPLYWKKVAGRYSEPKEIILAQGWNLISVPAIIRGNNEILRMYDASIALSTIKEVLRALYSTDGQTLWSRYTTTDLSAVTVDATKAYWVYIDQEARYSAPIYYPAK